MYAIIGITGQVGGEVAKSLLANNVEVRAIVRDANKGEAWAVKGANVALADLLDTKALTTALTGVEGAFVMIPAIFYPSENYSETREVLASLKLALEAANVPKVVCLSSVGAHLDSGLGIITQLNILEQELGKLSMPTCFVRAAWFMENTKWDVAAARETGTIQSFLIPLDRAIPMVSITDIGRVVAETLQQEWSGQRIIELEGPQLYSPLDLATLLGAKLDRSVKAIEAPRDQWQAIFESQGAPVDASSGRIEMLEGFNSEWIRFEKKNTEFLKGTITMEAALSIYL